MHRTVESFNFPLIPFISFIIFVSRICSDYHDKIENCRFKQTLILLYYYYIIHQKKEIFHLRIVRKTESKRPGFV